jgi:aryl-alcohol dehydrogenase-like predicted oxidoreductase
MKRRDFLKTSALAAPMISMFPADLSSMVRKSVPGKLEKRALGKTGEMLSVIGFGGIVVMNATEAEAAERVKLAIDCGVNYFDVAPSYGDAQQMLGPALEPYRRNVFLACKTGKRRKMFTD